MSSEVNSSIRQQVGSPELTVADDEILRAIRNVRFGSVEVIIHDSKIVQVERRDKIRFQAQR